MATSENCRNGEELPPEKPKSLLARKLVLLLLLVAAVVVFGLDFLPEDDSESGVVGPPKKPRPAAQAPAQPRNPQPATPQPPKAAPAPAPTPTPPRYERPPATVFVSTSPSDMPAPVEMTLAKAAPANVVATARSLPKDPVPTKVARYAKRLLAHYDTNGDGVIDATEQRQMQGEPAAVDYDADGKISFDELAAYTANYGRHRRMRLTGSMVEEAVAELPPLYIPTAELDAMAAAQAAAQQQQAAQQPQAVPVALVDQTVEPAATELAGAVPSGNSEAAETAGSEKADAPPADSPEQAQPASGQASSKRFVTPQSRLAALPDWFRTSDANGDGQLTVAEYTPDSEKTRLAEFARYDRNGDGVLTAQECPKKK